jgi:acetoin utilization deacetylase AcuC-like enzyme
MSLAFVIDDVFLGHRAPNSHPERPERLRAVRDALTAAGLYQRAHELPTRLAEDAELGLVHSAGYIDELGRLLPDRSGWLDSDTYYSPGTWDAARSAVGAVIDATRTVLSGQHQRALALVRPPGHHALADRAMGFCLFNNIAVAAADARARGATRVAVLDWDVHHGNGTEHIFYSDPSVLYLSCHEFPQYPGTGRPEDLGQGPGLGANVNVALPTHSGDREYEAAFTRVFIPALQRFAPDIILVSAGFDAHVADPLAGMKVTRAGYAAMARAVCDVADRVCEGRLVCALEGGYDLDGLAESTTALFEELVRERQGESPADAATHANIRPRGVILPAAERAIERTRACLATLPPEAPLSSLAPEETETGREDAS